MYPNSSSERTQTINLPRILPGEFIKTRLHESLFIREEERSRRWLCLKTKYTTHHTIRYKLYVVCGWITHRITVNVCSTLADYGSGCKARAILASKLLCGQNSYSFNRCAAPHFGPVFKSGLVRSQTLNTDASPVSIFTVMQWSLSGLHG